MLNSKKIIKYRQEFKLISGACISVIMFKLFSITFSILQNLFKLLTLTTQISILIEILDDDTDFYQEWDAALEKNISGEVPALRKSLIYASFILNGL